MSSRRIPAGVYGVRIRSVRVQPVAWSKSHYSLGLMAEVLQPQDHVGRRLSFWLNHGPYSSERLRDLYEATGSRPDAIESAIHDSRRAWGLKGAGLIVEIRYQGPQGADGLCQVPFVQPLLKGPDDTYKDPRIARAEWAALVTEVVCEEDRPRFEHRAAALEAEASIFCSCSEPSVRRVTLDTCEYDYCDTCRKEVRH